MTYIVMDYIVMAYIVMADIDMAHIVMAYIVMAGAAGADRPSCWSKARLLSFIKNRNQALSDHSSYGHTVMAYIVMAYIVMAETNVYRITPVKSN